MKRFFLLDWNNLIILFVAEVISIIFHNLIYSIFNIEEPVFFFLAVIIIPLYLLISIIYTFFEYHKLKKEVHIKRKLVLDNLEKENRKKIKSKHIKRIKKVKKKVRKRRWKH